MAEQQIEGRMGAEGCARGKVPSGTSLQRGTGGKETRTKTKARTRKEEPASGGHPLGAGPAFAAGNGESRGNGGEIL